jgi:hypothetical protein
MEGRAAGKSVFVRFPLYLKSTHDPVPTGLFYYFQHAGYSSDCFDALPSWTISIPMDCQTLLAGITDDPLILGSWFELKADAANVPSRVIHAPSHLGEKAGAFLCLNSE